ncbi:ketosteroid isomerase-like protein [Rhodovulum iodosum]|uniref:Ketosteroid isomerase-like protein n=1 Tax=Rhodovulum iodosum TaxID=68291 RepID=A0ABV3XVK6_9RHOB|nr:nuclear transport factor 2 family protein [Rhodovulum robiginosum]RSK33481.1 nuclear transport factor 2 family protein [Rhodovulum robiginosum]
MTFEEIANDLVAGVREGRAKANLDTLYAPDAVSVEAADMGQGRETRGLDGIRAKHDWWEGAMDMLEATTEGPFLHGPDRFAVYYAIKARSRESGDVSEMQEVGLYTVADGKIVREEFFYTM